MSRSTRPASACGRARLVSLGRLLGEIFETASAAQTEAAGARIAATLCAGDLVLLTGDVATGKTTLVRGACRALGVTARVTSPTFTLAKRYTGRLPVSHLDLYRLQAGLDGEIPDLLGEYRSAGSIVFAEWPGSTAEWLGPSAMRVTLRHLGGDRRRISVTWTR